MQTRTLGPWAKTLLLYTLLFAAGWLLVLGYVAANGKSLFWEFDGLSQQYVWFVYTGQWLREAVAGLFAGGGLPSTWDMSSGFGGDVLESVLCTVVNPFYAVSALVPPSHAEFAFEVSMMLQVYLAGIAFLVWSVARGTRRRYALVGAVSYTFVGSMSAIFSQPGFLFAPYAFPLLLWCADRVFAGKSPVAYVLMLAWSVSYSFYDSYMMIVLLVPYCLAMFFARVDAGGPGRARRLAGWVLRFVAYTLLALLLSSWLVLPQLDAVLGSGRLELERAVSLLYEPGYYVEFALGITNYYFAGGDVYAGVSALIIPAFFVLLMGWRRHTWLLAAFVGLTVMLLLPAAGSLMNAFEYPTNRWCWAHNLCASYVVARMLPELLALDRRKFVVLFCAMGAYGLACLALGVPKLTLFVYLCALLACACAAVLSKAGGREGLAVGAFALAALAAGTLTLAHSARGHLVTLVDAGSAWSMHANEGPAGLAAEAHADGAYDANYRWDRASSLSSVHNSNLVTGYMGADFYNSVYNDGVDALWSSLGMCDTWGINYGYGSLNSRSILDALLGVRYFYAPSQQASVLPFTFADAPVLAREDVKGQPRALYETEFAVPIASLRYQAMDESAYWDLPMVDRQKALLGAVVLEDGVQTSVQSVAIEDLGLDARALPFEIESADGCVVRDGAVVATRDGASLVLSYQGTPNAETYVVVEGLSYSDHMAGGAAAAAYSELTGVPAPEHGLRARSRNTGRVAVHSTIGEPVGIVTQISSAGEGYSGKHDWMCNAGYSSDAALARTTLVFQVSGVYTFDSFELVAQPLDGVAERVAELKRGAAYDLELRDGLIRCRTQASQDALLLLTVAYDEGWSAWVDGEPARILRADLGFMAIEVPQGTCEVELAYHTPGLLFGMLLTGVGAVLVLALAWGTRASRS